MATDLETWFALLALHADYAHALDAGEFARWPDFFTEDGVYRLQSRENHERGLPLATLALEGRGMLKDRVFGATETIFHDPYYQRHVVGAPRLLGHGPDGLRCEANYVVVRTHRDTLPEILSVGRYLDRVVATPAGLRFAERLAIFDNDLLPNSVIYPL